MCFRFNSPFHLERADPCELLYFLCFAVVWFGTAAMLVLAPGLFVCLPIPVENMLSIETDKEEIPLLLWVKILYILFACVHGSGSAQLS